MAKREGAWDQGKRAKCNRLMTPSALARLAAAATRKARDLQLWRGARAASVRPLEMDRKLARGSSALGHEVAGAVGWMQSNASDDPNRGGVVRAIFDEEMPALFGANMLTLSGRTEWIEAFGVSPEALPAAKPHGSTSGLDMLRAEMIRGNERLCHQLLQGVDTPGGCGSRLPNASNAGRGPSVGPQTHGTECGARRRGGLLFWKLLGRDGPAVVALRNESGVGSRSGRQAHGAEARRSPPGRAPETP